MIDINTIKIGDKIQWDDGIETGRIWTVEKITEDGNIYCSRAVTGKVHFTFYPFEYDELNVVENKIKNKEDKPKKGKKK